MSSLGQLSGRLDHHLQIVGDLTKALLALRAQLLGKLESLKLTAADVEKARETVAHFLEGLSPVLGGQAPVHEEHRVIKERLVQSGEQPVDWADDFSKLVTQLRAGNIPDTEQLDKVMRIVGYLQGEVAEDVRRLRSR